MKNILSRFALLILFVSTAFLFNSCKEEEEDNTISLTGKWTITSATFNPAVDLDGPGPNPPVSNAITVLETGLFLSSPCTPKTAANVQVEFAANGDFNLACISPAGSTTKIATYSSPGGNAINLTNVTVTNPNFNSSMPPSATNPLTLNFPLLAFTDVQAFNTGGVITLNFKTALPIAVNTMTGAVTTANTEIVFTKVP